MKILFLLVPYGYIILKTKRIPKEMTGLRSQCLIHHAAQLQFPPGLSSNPTREQKTKDTRSSEPSLHSLLYLCIYAYEYIGIYIDTHICN